MTEDDRPRDTATTSAGDESSGRILDDPTVAALLTDLVDTTEQLLTDVDQLACDLDDELVTIAGTVAWLVARAGGELAVTATELERVLYAETVHRGHPIEVRP